MATSKYTRKLQAIRRVSTGAAVGGATLRLALNRDWLVHEHRVNFTVSQAYTGVPTSVDVRDFVSTISVEASDGRRVFLTGAQAFDLGRFTEAGNARVTSTLAATSLAAWSIELHHENDAALLDMLTSLRSNELSTLDLVITFAADALNGFKAGTVPLVATYGVVVESIETEQLADVQFGKKLGAFKHFAEKQESPGTTVGAQPDIQLKTGNSTRFLMLHAYNTAGAVPVLSDAIIGNVRININGRDIRVTDFASMQRDNSAKRSFNQVGVGCIDFGDDENGFLNLNDVNQAKIVWDVVAGAPVHTVLLAQDYTQA